MSKLLRLATVCAALGSVAFGVREMIWPQLTLMVVAYVCVFMEIRLMNAGEGK